MVVLLVSLLFSFPTVRSSEEEDWTLALTSLEVETHSRYAQTQRLDVTGWKLNCLFSERQITTNPANANDYIVREGLHSAGSWLDDRWPSVTWSFSLQSKFVEFPQHGETCLNALQVPQWHPCGISDQTRLTGLIRLIQESHLQQWRLSPGAATRAFERVVLCRGGKQRQTLKNNEPSGQIQRQFEFELNLPHRRRHHHCRRTRSLWLTGSDFASWTC